MQRLLNGLTLAVLILALALAGCDTGGVGIATPPDLGIGGGGGNPGGGGGGGGGGAANSVATNGSGGATGQTTGDYNGRAYSAYVPTSYNQANPTPVVVACHDSSATYSAFFTSSLSAGWQAAADAAGFIFVSPDDTNAGANSFIHTTSGNFDLTKTRNEALSLLDAIYYGVGGDYNVETTQIFLVGFGDGAAFVDVAGWSQPEQWAGIAPYGGGVGGKSFPIARKIPVFFQCGTTDAQLANIQSAHGEWVSAGHQANHNWVNGVGHSWTSLNASGSSATTVYQWLSNALSAAEDVVSTFDPDQAGGGGGGGGGAEPGSGGSGGSYPGNVDRIVAVNGLGNQTARIYVPSSYNPATPMPMIICLHGQAGDGNAPTAAAQVRQIWSSVAEASGVIVVAQQGTSQGGSYIAGNAAAVMNAIIDDMWGAYNIATKGVFCWGFSAGGHVVHALALSNANFFAGYGTSAGVLGGAALQMGISPSSAARKIPYIASIGTSDQLHANALQDRTAFLNAGWVENTNYKLSEFNGGHTFNSTHCQTIWNFLKDFRAP